MSPAQAVIDEWPDNVDIMVYRGSTFGQCWEMDLADMSGETPPGPANLNESGVELEGHVRARPDATGDPIAVFDIQIVNAAARTIRPILTAEESAKITRNAYYDLEIRQGDYNETLLYGRVLLGKDTTRA